MEWDAVGAIAELMGAIAVLVTVGYLAVVSEKLLRAQNNFFSLDFDVC